MRSEVQILAQQDAQRERLMRRLTRVPSPSSNASLPMPFEACEILIMPVFYGVNASEDAEGFGDLGSIATNYEERTSVEKHVKNQILSELTEIFFGLCAQRALGTPPIFDKPLPGKLSPAGEVEEQTPGKTEGFLRHVFSRSLRNLHSGMYAPDFADSWKEFFASGKFRNYFDALAIFGRDRCQKNMSSDFDVLFKRAKKKKKNAAQAGGTGDNVEVAPIGPPAGTTSSPPVELWKTFQSAWEFGEADAEGRDDEDWNRIYSQLKEKISLILVPIRRKKSGSFSELNSQAVEDTLERLRALEITERRGLTVDLENLPPKRGSRSPFVEPEVTGSSGPPPQPPAQTPLPTSFLPFLNHVDEKESAARNPKATSNLFNYYFATETARTASSSQLLQRYDWNARPCLPSSLSPEEEPEEIGFAMIAFVSDPNWKPSVAIETLCNNSLIDWKKKFSKKSRNGNASSESSSGRSAPPKKGEFVSHMYSPWFHKAPSSHVGKVGLSSARWNYAANYYSCSSLPKAEATFEELSSFSDNLEIDQSEDFLPSPSGERASSDWGKSKRPTDPLDVFTLTNAVRWIEAQGGDADFLKLCTSVDEHFEEAPAGAPRSFNFVPGSFHRIPYDKFFMYAPDEEERGLEHSFFPWKRSDVQEFLNSSVLGLNKNVAPNAPRTLCINTRFLNEHGKTDPMPGCSPICDPPTEKRAQLRGIV